MALLAAFRGTARAKNKASDTFMLPEVPQLASCVDKPGKGDDSASTPRYGYEEIGKDEGMLIHFQSSQTTSVSRSYGIWRLGQGSV